MTSRGAATVLVAAAALLAGRGSAAAQTCALAAAVRPASTVILPGQPLEVTLRLRNATSTGISVHQPSEFAGNVTAKVAHESAPNLYREYEGPGWGLDCGRGGAPTPLAANAALTLSLKLQQHADRHSDPETSVLTPFVFSTPGTYTLKVEFVDEQACPEPGVSAVASVQVVAPQGDDLAVWTELKDCFLCAALLHKGTFNPNNAAERPALDKLRDLRTRYPRSRYAPMIRQALQAIDGRAPR